MLLLLELDATINNGPKADAVGTQEGRFELFILGTLIFRITVRIRSFALN